VILPRYILFYNWDYNSGLVWKNMYHTLLIQQSCIPVLDITYAFCLYQLKCIVWLKLTRVINWHWHQLVLDVWFDNSHYMQFWLLSLYEWWLTENINNNQKYLLIQRQVIALSYHGATTAQNDYCLHMQAIFSFGPSILEIDMSKLTCEIGLSLC
jgi:hypothetical protein